MFRYRQWILMLLPSLAWISGAIGAETASDVLTGPGNDLREPAQRTQAAARIKTLMDAKRSAAITRANQLGLPIRVTRPNGRLVELVDFVGDKPIYFTTHNVNAAISTGANLLRAAPYSMDGTGLTVGEWDGGSARSTHQEFGGRITVMDGAAAADHSTHVAGTIAAAGVVASAKGMAPAIHIDSYEWTNDIAEMTSRGASYPGEPGKIPLSNHSYGRIQGWEYTGLTSPSAKWIWNGTGTTTTGVETDFGKYDTNASDADALAFSLPYYLIVRSAGNERLDNPVAGDLIKLSSISSTITYVPASHPPGDGVYRSNGYDTIGADALAKNVLTVGSVGDAVSGSLRQVSNAAMSSYSSWGPTDDGRIKPDLVANGEALYSSLATTNGVTASDTAYGTYSGTSMAAPNATGSAALLVQWWSHLLTGQALRASTLKALLIHTADDLGRVGPDYQYGWGLVNVKAAADLLQAYKNSPGTRRVIEDQVTATATSRSFTFTWDGVSPIRATLSWTDPAGTATITAEDRTMMLKNDLDLKITGPTGTIYQPWVMPFVGTWTAASLTSAAVTGANHTDNTEQVVITSPGTPGTYSAVVSFTGTLTNSLQNFSVILSGGAATATAPAPALSTLSPTTSTAGTMALSLTGSNMLLGADVKLTKTGQSDVIAGNQEVTGDSATFRVNANGLALGLWNVVLTNPDGQTTTLANSFLVTDLLLSDTLESGEGGWTHSALTGSDKWALSTTYSHSSSTSFFASGPNTKNDNVLVSPTIAIPAGSSGLRLSFWHRYTFQNNRDGGVLEFSIDNGGTWFDVTASGSGAAFASGAYGSTISSSSSPINGRSAWSNSLTTFSQVVVNLTDSAKYAGKSLQVRWRLATNSSTASAGWYIDDIELIRLYSLTYNGNGNTGGSPPADPSAPYANGATVTVLGNTGSLVKTGYTFAGWNTAADGTGTAYQANNTFAMDSADLTLYAQWTINRYAITASAGSNGSISPSGVTLVNYLGSQGYTITPNSNCYIVDVLVDGSSVGAVTSYNFTSVAAAHSISASFAPMVAQTISFTLPASVAKSAGSLSLTGTASSGLPVSYTSSVPAIASVSGATLILHQAGTVTITANQAGNGSYYAAPSIQRTLVVTGFIVTNDAVTRQANSAGIKIPVASLLDDDVYVNADGSLTSGTGLTISGVTSGSENRVSVSGAFVFYTPSNASASSPTTFTYTVNNGSSSDSGTVTVTTIGAIPFNLNILRIVTPAAFNGTYTSITVEFAGVPNQTYQIQYSTTMEQNSWSIASPVPTGTTGTFNATFIQTGNVAADWIEHLYFRATR